MHALHLSFFVDQDQRPPSQLLEDWFSLIDVATAVAGAGVRVSVVQASRIAARLDSSGISCHFVRPDDQSDMLTFSPDFRNLLRALGPDVIHVHGLGFTREVRVLESLVAGTPILLQDHADRPPRPWKRRAWRRGNALAAGVAFCAAEQAEPFVRSRLFGTDTRIFQIPEWSSAFKPGDRESARAATGIHGNPALLWVGHLNANKDPLTVLRGFSLASRELPDAHLWCCYASAPLIRSVESMIARDAFLRDRVHLLGRIPRERMELHMNSCDLFVLGSHREGSSYSLIEALATGLAPVVTDIPSFRALTAEGSIGSLWPVANWRACGEALATVGTETPAGARERVRAHFEKRLSREVMGRLFADAYSQLIRASRERTP